MKKNIQLYLYIVIPFLVIFSLWLFISRDLFLFKNNITNDLDNIKNNLHSQTNKIEPNSEKKLFDDVKKLQNQLSQKIDEYKNTKQLQKKTIDKLLEEIDGNFIKYEYDPWKIEFIYLESMVKEVDDSIKIYDSENKNINIIINKVDKILDTNNLIEATYENNIFFETAEKENLKILSKEYYTQINNFNFQIKINCPLVEKDNYWIKLNLIAKSIKSN